jgi:hypothetical protein
MLFSVTGMPAKIIIEPKLSDSIEIHILQIASKWLLLCVHI